MKQSVKEFFIGVVQWTILTSCFPVICLVDARGNKKRRKDKETTEKRIQEFWKDNQPKPLPIVRPRALTLPLPETSQQHTSDQLDSLFFKLPFEIRLQIYELVLGPKDKSKALHIFETSKRLCQVRCSHEDGKSGDVERVGWQHECWHFRHQLVRSQPINCSLSSHWDDPRLLSLPKTCRRIYTEALPLLYSLNTFSVRSDSTLLHLSATIHPPHLAQIRSLSCDFILDFTSYPAPSGPYHHLIIASTFPPLSTPPPHLPNNTWPQAMHFLSTLPSLRSLKITITRLFIYQPASMNTADYPTTWQIRQALEPLKEIRQCAVYEVMLMWTAPERLRDILGETPFVLRDGGSLWEGMSAKYGVVSGGLMKEGWVGWSRAGGHHHR